MKRTLTLVTIVLALILSACAPALQAQSAAENKSPTSIVTPQIAEQIPLPSATPAVTTGTLEDSLLVAGWVSRGRYYQLYPIVPETGEALVGYDPISIRAHFYQATNPERGQMVFIVYETGESPTGGSLLQVDPQKWTAHLTPLDLDGGVTAHSFSPNGKFLTLAVGDRESRVVRVDLEQRAITDQAELDFLASRIKYAADGSAVFVYGTPVKDRFTVNESAAGPPQVALLDAMDLSLLWSVELTGVRDGIYPKEGSLDESKDLHQPGAAVYDLPGVVFAPQRDALYIVHSALDKLTTVDYAARQVETIEIRPQLSWFERLLWLTARVARAKVAEGASLRAQVSPDGKLLYVIGSRQVLVESKPDETMYELEPYGLQVIRVEDGTVVDQLDSQANDLAISADGGHLYLHTWKERGSETEIVPTGDLNVIARLEGNLAPVSRLNGEPLLASTDWLNSVKSRMFIVNPQSLSVLAEWSGTEHAVFIGEP
jgi:sugar lactone lactonase YvrE